MCGINGVLLKRKANIDIERQVRLMNDEIIYRGPDDEGFFSNADTALGMRRLSVIDLDTGHQPVFNEDKSKLIIFNGEIYNYKELRDDLKSKGHVFATNGDTEVLMHGYEEYGPEILEKLSGMFAAAIYDINAKELFLARDRFGKKPLHYYYDDEKFIFASELKSIINVWNLSARINKRALNIYLSLRYIPAPFTIYENIYKLEPGSCMLIKNNEVIMKKYWDISRSCNKRTDYEKSKAELRELLFDAVRKRMISDVPLGAFLSGGIDSGIITGIMSKLSEKPAETFSIGFRLKDFDESAKAQKVAKLNGTNHRMKILDYDDALVFLDKILNSLDEPFADASAIPTYFVSEFAKQHVTVVLTGDGGDELFGGYSKYMINYYSEKYRKIPRFIRKHAVEPLIKAVPDNRTIIRKIKKVVRSCNMDVFEQNLEMLKLGIKDLKPLVCDDFLDENALDFIKEKYDYLHNDTSLGKTLYTDMKIVIEGDMMTKVDRMSMLNSIEARSPFLDEKVVELAFSLPDEFKISGRNQKKILKDAFSDMLPGGIKNQTKQGFGVPVGEWFRGPLKGMLSELLDKKTIEEQGIFKYPYIENMISEHMNFKEDRSFELWALFVFQYWYCKYFLKAKASSGS